MRTFRHSVLRASVCVFAVAVLTVSAVAGPKYSSPEEAERNGISAYNGGYYKLAIPALEYAAEHDLLVAQYFLARLYADNNTVHTDHAKAYILFENIANKYADADPDDESQAPYVSGALTALARYVRTGIKELNVEPNPAKAAEYLDHAALFFSDSDAQFELAKLYLKGDVESDIARGKHWLSRLAQDGHAGAQAFLADLLWRGKYVEQDKIRALLLSSVAVKNAPPQERVWIEDIYQNIYCGASSRVRKQVDGAMVADWDRRYGRKPRYEDRLGLGVLDPSPTRTCANGEPLPRRQSFDVIAEEDANDTTFDGSTGSQQRFLRGSTGVGGRLRNVGTPDTRRGQ